MKKYLLFPGDVRSKHDGDVHYIDAHTLAELYGVRFAECVVAKPGWTGRESLAKGLVHLRPRYHGDYSISRDEP